MNVEKVAKHYQKLLDEDREELETKIRKETLGIKNKALIRELASSGIIQFLLVSGGFLAVFKYGHSIPGLYEGDILKIKSLLAVALVVVILNLVVSTTVLKSGTE